VKALPFIIGWVARHQSRLRQVALFAGLLGLVVLALAFAHVWDAALPNAAPRAKCFETFWSAQWPKWIGCAMAAHESLAAGLIGLWAAILAAWLAYSGAWLAYSGIQMQIEEERRKDVLRQVQAKATAAIAITQVIYAAAATLYAVTQARKAQDQEDIAFWDDSIKRCVSSIDECLNHFAVSEAVRDLGGRDRPIYVGIVGQLSTFVTINRYPSEHVDRATRLQRQYDALMKLRELLAAFDSELAAIYDRDAFTVIANPRHR
jgi:hypothetical protein